MLSMLPYSLCVIPPCRKLLSLLLDGRVNVNRQQIRLVRKRASPVVNPGIQNRLELFGNRSLDDISKDELDEIEYYEPGVSNVKSTQEELEREAKNYQFSRRVKIIENKYFKQKNEPALLTWDEREQICHLHQLNSEKWSVPMLSISFPATESTIQKILNAKWKPSTVEEINKYNKRVVRNWKMFHEGKLKVTEELKAHLSKFTSREKIFLPRPGSHLVLKSELKEEPKCTEFSSIVTNKSLSTSCSGVAKTDEPKFFKTLSIPPEDETYVIDEDYGKSKKSPITLEKYREKMFSTNKNLDIVDKAMLESYRKQVMSDDSPVPKVSASDFGVVKFKETSGVEKKVSTIREWIKIPRNLKGKGSLYKLDDCYYDVDGEFLFRVPGM